VSVFNYERKIEDNANAKCTEPFGTLCKLMERDGYCVEAQELHIILLIYHYSANNKEAIEYHLRKVVELAYAHDLLFALADAESYYADAVNAILREYPASFAERIHKISRKIYDNFARFAEKTFRTNVYERLSKSDYRYVFYAIEGFSNKQVANMCSVSERTVSKKYNDIYCELGVHSKQELVEKMGTAFGKKA